MKIFFIRDTEQKIIDDLEAINRSLEKFSMIEGKLFIVEVFFKGLKFVSDLHQFLQSFTNRKNHDCIKNISQIIK